MSLNVAWCFLLSNSPHMEGRWLAKQMELVSKEELNGDLWIRLCQIPGFAIEMAINSDPLPEGFDESDYTLQRYSATDGEAGGTATFQKG